MSRDVGDTLMSPIENLMFLSPAYNGADASFAVQLVSLYMILSTDCHQRKYVTIICHQQNKKRFLEVGNDSDCVQVNES